MNYTFSDGVRKVLAGARDEAVKLGHAYVSPEHLLLSLLRHGREGAERVLALAAVDRSELRERVLALVPPGETREVLTELPYTGRAKKVLEVTMSVAREVGARMPRSSPAAIETDHLLLALTRVDTLARQVLASAGLTTERVVALAGRLRGGGLENSVGSPDATGATTAVLPASGSGGPAWFLQIDSGSDSPIYEQIIARIEEAVATERVLPGERLPPVRELAAELGIAPGTVARAYSALEQRGVLETGGARGTRIAERRPAPASPTAVDDQLQARLLDLLRPVAVAAYHMRAQAQDVRVALESAMRGILA